MVYIGTVVLFAASLMQSVILPKVVPISVRPHLLVLLVVAICLAESLYDAVIWGFMGGIMLDLMSGPALPLGSNAFLLVLVALLASLGQANPFQNLIFVPLVMSLVCTAFYHIMLMVLSFMLGNDVAFLDNLWRIALPSALLNAVLLPVTYSAMLWLSERVGRRVKVEW